MALEISNEHSELGEPKDRKGDYVRIWLFHHNTIKDSFVGLLTTNPSRDLDGLYSARFITPKESFGRYLKRKEESDEFKDSICMWLLPGKWRYTGEYQRNAKMPKKWNPPRNLK